VSVRVLVALFRLCCAGIRSWRQILELVLQMKNDKVSGTDAEIGRFPAFDIGKTKANRAIRLGYVPRG
jgi:hypothetical protein